MMSRWATTVLLRCRARVRCRGLRCRLTRQLLRSASVGTSSMGTWRPSCAGFAGAGGGSSRSWSSSGGSTDPRQGLACRVWQARRAYKDLSERGLLRGAERQPAPILRYLGTLERTIQRDLEAFGLTPRAFAELGLDLARTKDVLADYLAERPGD